MTTATVEAWGGGGAGGGATGNPAKGGGGAGGQYSRRVVTVVPGNNYAVVVGAGGTGGTGNGPAGGDSTFATNVVVAKGGAGGTGVAANNAGGAAGGGSISGGIGDTVFAGGSGSAGVISGGACADGGAGGGGAGSTGAGGNASGNTAGVGTATGGGAGGAGRNSSGNGNNGSALGGAGGGACAESNTNRSGGTGGAGRVTITYTPAPVVTSINRASANPSDADSPVSWTVVFSASVTGVDATDFVLVPGGGLAGASITSVSGSGTTWTVTANPGGTSSGTLGLNLVDDDSIVSGGVPLGGTGNGNGDFIGQVYTIDPPFCAPPSNVPGGVTVSCVCDRFGRASLNPSTIYGGNWIVSTSDTTGISPYINGTSGLLRLTENTGNNAKAATVPGIFPAAGNYISVEFQHYAYAGSGADGIAVTLSDYSVPAVPGAFGGSLGYAQKNQASCGVVGGCPGFAGGWVGVAIDEFGNYQNPTEGRIGGPGARVDSVGVRGSGSGQTGYNWLAGTTTLAPGIDNTGSTSPAPGYYYQVIVDARNDPTSTAVTVNRDTGSGYATLISVPDVYTAATAQGFTQSPVPGNWQISFTGSTGGSTNIHEIGGVRVCAQTVAPPTGGTASGFSAIDEGYPGAPTVPAYQNFQTGHIYTKLQGTAFRLWVAALTPSAISAAYSAVSAKYVQLKFVDNSGNVCGTDSARTCNSTCTNTAAVETGATQIVPFVLGGPGVSLSPSFTLNSAWRNLVAVMKECTTSACSAFTATAPACSVDSFSVRPTGIDPLSVTSTAIQTGTTGTPIFKAGADTFDLTATIPGVTGNPSRYTGVLKLAVPPSTGIQAVSPATTAGTVLPATFGAATSGTPNATATGNTFTYSEAGTFLLRGYNPASDATSPRGIYDGVNSATECASLTAAQCDTLRAATWVGIDSITSKGDCVQNSFSNTKDASGKYGCSFGLTGNPPSAFGRFTPAYFNVAATHACVPGTFTYSGQPFANVTATPYNATNAVINNYRSGGFAKDVTISDAGVATNFVTGTNTIPSTAFTGTSGSSSAVTYKFPLKDTSPATLTLRAVDADGVSSSGHTEPSMLVRSGRAIIENVFGSELLALSMPLRVQYYDATNGWVTHVSDTSCTSIVGGNITVSNAIPSSTTVPGSITIKSPSNTSNVSLTGTSPSWTIGFTAPGGDGYADVTADLSARPWLQYNWDGVDQLGDLNMDDDNPRGRVTFGIYRGSPRHIYLRERY